MAAIGATVGYVALRQPPAAARLLALQSVVVFAVPTTRPAVAITLDDGPSAALTPALLDVLRDHGAHASLFVLGSNVEAHPEVVASAHEAGHEIGNHGWVDRPAALLSRAELRRDLQRTGRAIAGVTGAEPRLMRPGSGWLRPVQLRDVRAQGLTVVLGSVATLDLRVADVGREVRFVADRLQPGAVVVLHEGAADRAGVVDLLDGVLAETERRGLETVTVSALLGAGASGE
jgi:peptidoglycan-N-acetylglucosamine deacetylase